MAKPIPLRQFLHRARRPAIFALGLFGAILFVTSIAICVDGLNDHKGKADVGVVFGSKVETDGQPSTRLASRLDKTVELYRRRDFDLVIVSGGFGREGYDEATVMKAYLLKKGIPADRVLVDSDGDTTMMTAQNGSALMRSRGLKSAVLISQYFHISRARLAFERCGIAETYGVHADIFNFRDVYSIPREALGYYSYLLRKCTR